MHLPICGVLLQKSVSFGQSQQFKSRSTTIGLQSSLVDWLKSPISFFIIRPIEVASPDVNLSSLMMMNIGQTKYTGLFFEQRGLEPLWGSFHLIPLLVILVRGNSTLYRSTLYKGIFELFIPRYKKYHVHLAIVSFFSSTGCDFGQA